MKRYGKIMLCMLWMMFSVLTVGTTCEAAGSKKIIKKNDNFSVTVELGLNQYAACGKPIQIKVKVQSKENYEGEVRVVPMNNDSTVGVALAKDITVAGNETKSVSFVLANAGYNGQYCIQLVNTDGKIIYSERDAITLADAGVNAMIGILSDDYTAFHYMDGLTVSMGPYELTSHVLELHTEDMPDNSDVLNVLGYLVIDHYDTAQLSEKQYEALQSWVRNGGILIIGTGSNYQNVLHCFNDGFLTGTFGTVDKKTLSWFAQGQEITMKDVDCVALSLEDSQELLGYSEDGTAYYKEIGRGRVIMLAYDLGMEPFVSDRMSETVADLLLHTAQNMYTADVMNGSYYDNGSYDAYRIAKMTDDSKKPSGWLYGIILFAYVVLVGPVLYLILKACKQREKIWIAVPVVSVLFTGIIYLTSLMYRVNVPLVDTVSLISLDPDWQTERIYTNVTCPRVRDYTLVLNQKYRNISYDTDSYSYDSAMSVASSAAEDGTYSYMIKDTAKGRQFTFRNRETFHDNSFVAISSEQNKMGTIAYDLNCTTSGFSGSVTNQTDYDLEGVVVTFENHIYLAGDLKAGQTVEIDPTNLKTTTGYGTFNQLYTGGTGDRKAYRYNQIDSMMETYYMHVSEYGKGIIWAKIDGYQPDYVEEGKVKSAGVGIVYTAYEAEYTDVKGAYYQSLDPMITQVDGDYDTGDRTMYNNSIQITYSFTGYPGITRLELRSKNSDITYGIYADVYAYNPATDDYEQIFKDSDVIAGDELSKYVVNNTIRLRYDRDDSRDEQGYLPRICARGDE